MAFKDYVLKQIHKFHFSVPFLNLFVSASMTMDRLSYEVKNISAVKKKKNTRSFKEPQHSYAFTLKRLAFGRKFLYCFRFTVKEGTKKKRG